MDTMTQSVAKPARGSLGPLTGSLFAPVVSALVSNRIVGVALAATGFLQVALLSLRLPVWQCPFRAVMGLPCPGCGLSRALLRLFNGQWTDALRLHPFAPLFLAGWLFLTITCLLPKKPRLSVAAGAARIERRTGITVLLLVAFAVHGLARMAVWL